MRVHPTFSAYSICLNNVTERNLNNTIFKDIILTMQKINFQVVNDVIIYSSVSDV